MTLSQPRDIQHHPRSWQFLTQQHYWSLHYLSCNYNDTRRNSCNSDTIHGTDFTVLKKVKASHTDYRVLGPELIRCTGSQPTGDYVIHPVIGCH